MGKKIGLVLAGSGVQDGSEIHEATLSILYLTKAGAEIVFLAPDVEQFRTVNHATGETMAEKRNVLVESARIARGNILNISRINVADLDGVVFPGGYGAATNLCEFATKGPSGEVNPDVRRFIEQMYDARKPIGAMCIAPGLISMVLGRFGVRLTIGTDPTTASTIEKTGAVHVNCPVDEIVVDEEHRIVSTPAYMLGPDIAHIAKGIEKLCYKVVEMA